MRAEERHRRRRGLGALLVDASGPAWRSAARQYARVAGSAWMTSLLSTVCAQRVLDVDDRRLAGDRDRFLRGRPPSSRR